MVVWIIAVGESKRIPCMLEASEKDAEKRLNSQKYLDLSVSPLGYPCWKVNRVKLNDAARQEGRNPMNGVLLVEGILGNAYDAIERFEIVKAETGKPMLTWNFLLGGSFTPPRPSGVFQNQIGRRY